VVCKKAIEYIASVSQQRSRIGSRGSITSKLSVRVSLGFIFSVLVASIASAQRVAILAPDNAEGSRTYATKLEHVLDGKIKLVDDALSRSAFDAAGFRSPYNLSLDDAKRVGQAIGCDFFVLVRSAVQRRSSFEREEYYDGYAIVFLVSARTGRLVSRPLRSELADKPGIALNKLDSRITEDAESLITSMRSASRAELDEKEPPPMEEPPDETSPAAKNFKAPVPFRRMKPEYTALADRYDVTATVDILVDLDENGHVLRTEIARWAGYDLDESVEKAVHAMNWRAAERNGKFIPMRFLVRYNFKKVDKSENP
jgi:hypothetical protein